MFLLGEKFNEKIITEYSIITWNIVFYLSLSKDTVTLIDSESNHIKKKERTEHFCLVSCILYGWKRYLTKKIQLNNKIPKFFLLSI